MSNGGEAGPVKEAPPRGLENYAVALETIERAPEVVFGVGVDPFKPRDVVVPPSFSVLPPRCPVCRTYLYPITTNPMGDLLFECLNADGYEAVFRVGSQAWEARPGRPVEQWRTPYFGTEPPLPPDQAKAAAAAYAAGQPPAAVPDTAAVPSEAVPAPPAAAAPVSQSLEPSSAPAAPPPQPALEGELGTDWLLIADAAAVVGKPTIEVYNLVRRKAVPIQRVKGRVYVGADAVIAAFQSPGASASG